MLLLIDHETRLTYTAPVSEAVIEVRTAPPSQDDQTVLGYRLRVVPVTPVTSYRDGFGNKVELFNLFAPHSEVLISSTACVRVHRRPAAEALAAVPHPTDVTRQVDAAEFLRPSPQVDFAGPVRAFAAAVPITDGGSVRDAAEAVMAAVRAHLQYEKLVTEAHTRVSEALELGRGVCQDFTHLFLAAARLRGLPARYVSGYVHQPGELATHAWAQVWGGPEIGWANIDPTHGRWVGSEHVVTAVGRDFSDVPPNRGVWKGTASEAIGVAVGVRPVDRVPDALVEPAGAAWFAPGMTAGPPQKAQPKALRQQQSQQQ
ncbi:transglutaminase family protein [Frigoriglobus tundricola]|uniref:Protein containing transglutaminase-like domain, putative cysteine protease n=1 Tax=Frigoriglobus tundricola TaxID=2774151 RepID=A0A6M5YGN0_9BACT|nr:transglutaminase family protein [Frigoriglobus tundricola]QJW93199.1 Protein containing transglutaminase-like domain, putative cysteine protease [Frigoriglobus tundricola]